MIYYRVTSVKRYGMMENMVVGDTKGAAVAWSVEVVL
jgi:hypothetical protein